MSTVSKPSSMGRWPQVWGVPEELAPRYAAQLRRQLMAAFAMPEPPRIARAYQTGLDCLRATGVDLTPLPEEAQRAFRFTPQHRMELLWLDHFAGDPFVPQLPGLTVYDGRAMYLGVAQLPFGAGPVRHVGPAELLSADDRGRVRVRFAVPAGWQHVGLLAVPQEGGGWWWPRAPGWEGETWCDLCEYRLARAQGWLVLPQEGWLLRRAEPLAAWGRRLEALYRDAGRAGDALLARLYRNIAVQTIGELYSDGRRGRDTAIAARPELIGPGEEWSVDWDEAGGMRGYVVHEETGRGKPADTFHPEWTAGVWSYSRYRVLRHMLTVPFESLVAVRGDAIYLTADPRWEDRGAAGQLRRQGSLAGPLPAPKNLRELSELGRRAKG